MKIGINKKKSNTSPSLFWFCSKYLTSGQWWLVQQRVMNALDSLRIPWALFLAPAQLPMQTDADHRSRSVHRKNTRVGTAAEIVGPHDCVDDEKWSPPRDGRATDHNRAGSVRRTRRPPRRDLCPNHLWHFRCSSADNYKRKIQLHHTECPRRNSTNRPPQNPALCQFKPKDVGLRAKVDQQGSGDTPRAHQRRIGRDAEHVAIYLAPTRFDIVHTK